MLNVLPQPRFLGFLVSISAVEFVRGALFIVLLPTYIPSLGMPVWAVGAVLSAHYSADLLLKVWVGSLADRNGAWRVLLPGFVLTSIALVLLPEARTFSALAVIAVLVGVGSAGAWPAVVAGTTKLAPETLRASVLSSVFIAWLGGGGLGPLLANFVPPGRAPVAFWALAGVSLIPLVVASIFASLRDDRTPERATEAPSRAFRALLAHVSRFRPLWIGMFVPTFVMGMLLPILVPFAYRHFALTPAQFALVMGVTGGTVVLSLIPAGRLVDRFGFQRTLIAGYGAAAVSLLAVVHQDAAARAVPFLMLLGMAYALILPAWNGLIASSVPESDRGAMMGFVMTVEGLGMAAGPTVGGVLAAASGGGVTVFHTAAVLLGLLTVLYFWIPVGRFRVAE